MNWVAISPNGEFLVRFISGGVELAQREGGRRRQLRAPGRGEHLFGKRALFLGGEKAENVLCYGGEEKELSTDAFRPLAESPDGRLVALATAREKPPVRVEVWDVEEVRKLCEWSEVGAFELAFGGPPYRVLCATRVVGEAGAFWISSELRVHDAATGRVLQRLDLAAGAGPSTR
jgi:hypothetical protein